MKPNTPTKTKFSYVVQSRVGSESFAKSFNFDAYGGEDSALVEANKFCEKVSHVREIAEMRARKIIIDCLVEIYYG